MENEIFSQNKQDSHPNSVFGKTLVAAEKQATDDSKQKSPKKQKEKETEDENKSENHGLVHILSLKHYAISVILNTKEILQEPKDTINNFFDGGRDRGCVYGAGQDLGSIVATDIYYCDVSNNGTKSQFKFCTMQNDHDC